jgi:hypothetical protein
MYSYYRAVIERFRINCNRANCVFLLAMLIASVCFLRPDPVHAEVASNFNTLPINLSNQVAQVTPPPQFIPTDVTPFTITPERNSFSPGLKFKLFQVLPERLWFNATTEVSQRLDTNSLFTFSNPKANYAFRALPNLTVGYNIFKNTSIYCNYFVIKDVFARDYNNINFPTTQSLSWGIQHNKQLGEKTNLQYNFQARELWQTSNLHQFDFLPGITLTHIITPNNIVWASTLLQLRGGNYFVAPTREIDPFYTLGYMYRHKAWALIINDTLVTNFRHPPFNDSIPQQSNMSMIADIEVNHPVTKKIPGLLAFVRAEPIWNWDSQKAAGISGFDFRLYMGLRISMSKPSYYGNMLDMRKQLIKTEEPSTNSSTSDTSVPATPSASSNSPADNASGSPANSAQAPLHSELSTKGSGQTGGSNQSSLNGVE